MAKKSTKKSKSLSPLQIVALAVIVIGAFFVVCIYQKQAQIGLGTPQVMKKFVITKMYNIIEERQALMARANSMFQISSNESFGEFLVDKAGMSLYASSEDTSESSSCYNDCAYAWRPVWTQGTIIFGEGVDGELDIMERSDGPWQVTYNGQPLYYYIGDEQPGHTEGNGIEGIWSLVRP
ncbi:hypothetical protein JW758_04260 [Candidatus Peregrinibacteria bacterium]|nr:hypothetical protein [Candidatus Peregrinibacteria bacterium]